ncbi:hypothetical protein [Niallia sp. Krafla_26]|uniref:hypothetical protein n=1 Tax=Niallia sp. Krafla_26 TaxID=3064703 RepID=UPI003D17AE36
MAVVKNDVRYEILAREFKFLSDEASYFSQELKKSLERIFSYVYNHTDLFYIESIDEKLLYDYIDYHRKMNFRKASFCEALKDTKNFLYFSKHVKGFKKVPEIDLSVNNVSLWSQL